MSSGRTEIDITGKNFDSTFFIESSVLLEEIFVQGWVPILLPLAMAIDEDLSLGFAIDPGLRDNCQKATDLLSSWFRSLSEAQILAAVSVNKAKPNGVGLFFTGGVDSFASLLSHQAEITHLIYVVGFDIKRSQTKLAAETIQNLKEIARLFNKEFIVATTNIRETSNRMIGWGSHYHGAALAGVALAHSHLLKKVIIPSSCSEKEEIPWGSHSQLDPLWSSSSTQIVHDSVELSRYEKVRAISDNEIAMKYLRVCWKNSNEAYNCGECEKCLRTMVSLYSFGALERCSSLPNRLNLAKVRAMKINSVPPRTFALDNLQGLKHLKERDLQLERAVAFSIRRSMPARLLGNVIERLLIFAPNSLTREIRRRRNS